MAAIATVVAASPVSSQDAVVAYACLGCRQPPSRSAITGIIRSVVGDLGFGRVGSWEQMHSSVEGDELMKGSGFESVVLSWGFMQISRVT